ncbi:MAG TPA: tetratricopeptide repeat protein [Caulobacteraceae bacterium]|jgi:tetratricopeptide (TPR) repeat protein|nr:tetratricopeptide repeat protein [Caulobacteraceae bacterium]
MTTVAPLPQDQIQRLQTSSQLLQQGRREEAIALLRSLVRDAPRLAQAQRLLGVALGEINDLLGAETAYRAALAADPSMTAAVIGLAEVLRILDRGTEAVDLLAPLVGPQTTDLGLLTYLGFALQSIGRWDEAAVWMEQAARTSPQSGVAEHNLASSFGDLSRVEESEAAARRAFAKGLDAPETWLVLARALHGQGRPEEAQAAYREVLSRRPDYPDALYDLAREAWTRTGSLEAAEAQIDPAIARNPDNPFLLVYKAKVQEFGGASEAALETLERASRISADAMVLMPAAQLAVKTDPLQALEYAQRAFAVRPDNYGVIATLAQVRLALGRPAEAAGLVEILTERQPWDQYALALLATCWRLNGDARYRELYDYDAFVRTYRLEPPPPWTSLEAFLADVADELEPLHPFKAHPVGQSVRFGSQTLTDLKHAQTPALKGMLQALDAPIRTYLKDLGPAQDPLRRRITGGYRFDGVWSVRLRPGGFHVDHVHHRGWISSACYVQTPAAVNQGREGWLKFGEPGIATEPPLEAERFERPEPGKLVLFPAYMWHGTVPFTGEDPRLSIAFDVLPAAL